MANIRYLFHGTQESETNKISLECWVSTKKEVVLQLKENDTDSRLIALDVSTAIKFSKQLRIAISNVKEVQND